MSKDFSFMNEKIKEKPFYKKKWVQIAAAAVSLALLFGAVAGGTFAHVSAVLKSKQEQEQMEEIQIPKDHPESGEPEVTAEAEPVVTEPPAEEEQLLENCKLIYEEIGNIAEEAAKSMVTVTALRSDVDWFNEDYESRGHASGIIIGDNSVELLILTKYEAVSGSDGIRVTFADHTETEAALKKFDASTGLAVISVNLSDIPSVTNQIIKKTVLGSSLKLSATDPVIAVGWADGSEGSVNAGMLTSVQKSQSVVDGEYTVLVTDLIKNPGADGVLINFQGQVLGVLTQKQLLSQEQNVLIAYGISDIKGIIEHLSNNQDVTYLGIKGVSVTEEAEEQGVPQGVYVTEVQKDSPAMLGGIQTGDVLQKINGQQVADMKDISEILQKLSDKQNITLEGLRLTKDGYKQMQYQTALSVLE